MAKKNKYADWTKEELIKRVTALDKRKKYGLVWDEEKTKEKFEADAEGKFPVLKEVKTKEIKTDPKQPTHILIEGDNYHALSVLNYTHENSIDIIYADPPYNTGNKSWKYNNDYVERDDSYRHSKWLTFMRKRLVLAKKLLKPTGIFIITIDNYEINQLGLLLDDIWGENNRLGFITIMHNPRGRSDDKYFATSHEYALFYAKNIQLVHTNKLPLTEEQEENFKLEDDISYYRPLPFKRTGSNSTPDKRPKLYYPIFYNSNTKQLTTKDVTSNNWIKLLPKDSNGKKRVWRWGIKSFEERKLTEIIVKEDGGNYNLFTKDRIKEGRKPKTIWVDPKYDASSHGTILLQNLFGSEKVFDYPKSLYAVIDTLIIANNKNSITILDFFAGSGTTGHAVLELNNDGGKRRFILCTNNENNVCTNVCYPRIKKVIEGYHGKISKQYHNGLQGNLKYFKTSFVPQEPTDKNKELLTKEATEMLCLRENAFEFVSETQGYKIYKNDKKYLGIIIDQSSIDDFKKEVKKYNKPINVYVFSLTDEDFSEEFTDLKKKVKVCSIPEAILRVYRRIFK